MLAYFLLWCQLLIFITCQSTHGYSIFIDDNLVSWSAKKQYIVAPICKNDYGFCSLILSFFIFGRPTLRLAYFDIDYLIWCWLGTMCWHLLIKIWLFYLYQWQPCLVDVGYQATKMIKKTAHICYRARVHTKDVAKLIFIWFTQNKLQTDWNF